jgi:anaerobic selenocysteine-containing dehydrogenase
LLGFRFQYLWGATDMMSGYGLDNGPLFAHFFETKNTLNMYSDPALLDQSKYVIVWGANPSENQHRVMKHLVEAQERGAKIVDIGLIFDGTAGKADWFIPVKPGSDPALALSMAQVIIKENLYDREYILNKTVAPFLVRSDNGQFYRNPDGNYMVWDHATHKAHPVAPQAESLGVTDPCLTGEFEVEGVHCKPAFQKLIDHLAEYTPEAQEAITGVSPTVVRQLTHEYASVKPAVVLGALGLRYRNQGESYRALLLLGVLTGNIGIPGGGVTTALMPTGYPIVFNDGPILFPNGPENDKSKYVRQADFYEQVKTGEPWPIKAMLKVSGNPVHNCPNRSRWLDDTFPQMELIVDHDIWMTDTGEYADYVLPDCTSFERMELISSACYNHIVLQEPAIEPLGEARDPAFLFRELSKRVGLGEHFDKTAEEWLELRLQSPMVQSVTPPVTIERLKKEKRIRANVPETPFDASAFGFGTPSGRWEFYVEELAVVDEALARYMPPLEVRPEKMVKHPYHFFTGRQRFFMQSLFTDDPLMIKLSGGQPLARMNPLDAMKEGVKDGDTIECFNQRGKVKATARLDEAIPPGTVMVMFGWRQRQFEEGTYSELLVPLGGRETLDDLSNRWWDIVVQHGKVGSMFAGAESAAAGAFDCIWDCVCDVRKANGKNGGQK